MTDYYKNVMDCLEVARNRRFCAGAETAAKEMKRLEELVDQGLKAVLVQVAENKKLQKKIDAHIENEGDECPVCVLEEENERLESLCGECWTICNDSFDSTYSRIQRIAEILRERPEDE
jgi:hypothetical protein